MGLVAAELERRGIATASITLLADVTRKVRPPRALEVDYPLGFPLGEANNPTLQRRILEALLTIVPGTDIPLMVPFVDSSSSGEGG